jgi:HEPN domain-containing protein
VAKDPSEWLTQADYDLETAQILLDKQRNFYAVFMAHLAVEKALKGLLREKLGEIPPKTHDLNYLIRKIGIQPEEEMHEFLIQLTEAQIMTEFPEDYEKLQREFPAELVQDILMQSKTAVQWVKEQYND